ncbi:MAG: carbohydrate ABC transporter permease [Clostridia bacterium]|nr:carbohydrate ABC transporter permease [Clostridia bacterium]
MKYKSVKQTHKIGNLIVYAILTFFAIIVIFPIVYSLAGSFKSLGELFINADKIFPEKATIDNYVTVITSRSIRLGRMFLNSMYYTVANVAIMLIISSLNAYVFARGNFPGKKIIFVIFSALMFINMGSITVYPLFEMLNVIHLNSSLWGLILIKAFGIPVVNIYLVKSYIETLPKELDEAAKVDGCSFAGTFFKIILPLLKPILTTVAVLTFNGAWNEYLMPSIFTMSNPEQQTLMVGITALKQSGEAAANWTVVLAAANLSLIPTLVAYVFGNRYFVSGLAAGSVKG